MAVLVSPLREGALLLEYVGISREEELLAAYNQILIEPNLRYLLADTSEMMIVDDSVYRTAAVVAFFQTLLSRDSFQQVILVVPERKDDMRDFSRSLYVRLGYEHKLRFVDNRQEGLALLDTLLG